jgi:hypothetical protein
MSALRGHNWKLDGIERIFNEPLMLEGFDFALIGK